MDITSDFLLIVLPLIAIYLGALAVVRHDTSKININKQSKNSIRGNIENIYKAVGADGLIEFYGYLSEDTTTDSVQSIVENADDIEKDPGERFEEIETASEIVTIDSVGQDDSNDINSPDLNFFDQVKLAFKANDDD